MQDNTYLKLSGQQLWEKEASKTRWKIVQKHSQNTNLNLQLTLNRPERQKKPENLNQNIEKNDFSERPLISIYQDGNNKGIHRQYQYTIHSTLDSAPLLSIA